MVDKDKAEKHENTSTDKKKSEIDEKDLDNAVGGRLPPTTPVQAPPAGNVS